MGIRGQLRRRDPHSRVPGIKTMFPIDLEQSKSLDRKSKKGGFQVAQASTPLKTTLAVEKMACPAVGSHPMGEGTDRGVSMWGILIILSLTVCHVDGLHLQESQSPQNLHPHPGKVEFNLEMDCELCLKGTQIDKHEGLGTQLENKKGNCSGNTT